VVIFQKLTFFKKDKGKSMFFYVPDDLMQSLYFLMCHLSSTCENNSKHSSSPESYLVSSAIERQYVSTKVSHLLWKVKITVVYISMEDEYIFLLIKDCHFLCKVVIGAGFMYSDIISTF
jgi:hypothetical protein